MRIARVVLIILALSFAVVALAEDKNHDAFAQCLTKKQVTMYGAFWCPHCKDQKELFGRSFVYINYVECAVPGEPPNVQTPVCRDKQIRKYPTWIFPDGERIEAIQTMEQLSQKSGCKLP